MLKHLMEEMRGEAGLGEALDSQEKLRRGRNMAWVRAPKLFNAGKFDKALKMAERAYELLKSTGSRSDYNEAKMLVDEIKKKTANIRSGKYYADLFKKGKYKIQQVALKTQKRHEGVELAEKEEPMDFLAMLKSAEDDVKKYGPSKPATPDASDQAIATAEQMGLKQPQGRVPYGEHMRDKQTKGWKESATLAQRLVKALSPKVKASGYMGPFKAKHPGANYRRWFWRPPSKGNPWIIVVAQGDVPAAPHRSLSFVRVIVTNKPSGHRTEWEGKPSSVGPKTYVHPRKHPSGGFYGTKGHFKEGSLDDLLSDLRDSQE
jgi:hypothetical protein